MTRLRQIRTLYGQFGPVSATRMLAARVARHPLDRYAIPSYAQYGEDRIIGSILASMRTNTNFYVDVGSNHPVRFSNTFALYQRGWRGIAVDANAKLVRLHRRLRPRDTCVHAVVSDRVETRAFTEFDDDLVSSLEESHVRDWSRHRNIRAVHRVTTQPLADILDAHRAPRDFEVLTVDVEGHDLQVLQSLRLPRYRPRLIVVEMHGFDLSATTHNPVVALLADHGYDMVAFAKPNGFFLHSSDGRLHP